ncbi:HAD family hydrolase [Candidatus Woesearchaeota archaeon]|nr:HAD family hydrolase [Candidatus Woesearchaeota archaeon]
MVKAIVFDFDGVLVDSFSACYIPASMKYEDLSPEEYKSWFLGNIYEKKTTKKIKDETFDFLTTYSTILSTIAPNQGVIDLLKELSKTHTLFINSSSPKKFIHDYLKKHDLDKSFVEILGFEVSTSKVEKFEYLFNKYNLKHHDCVFITDTVGDILEANHLNIKTIAVEFGFHDRKKLEQGKPFKIISNFQELTPLLMDLNH